MQTDKVYRTELTPLDFLRRSADVFPRKIAVVHGERRYTYAEFEARANRLANGLVEAGVERGERIAFLSPNTPAMLEAHYGVPAAGCTLVAINTRLASAEIGHILEHSGATALFVDHELAPLIEPLELDRVRVIRIADTGEPDDPYEAFLAAASPAAPARVLEDEEEPISINYTGPRVGPREWSTRTGVPT